MPTVPTAAEAMYPNGPNQQLGNQSLQPDPRNPFQRMFGTAPPAAREFAATMVGSKEPINEGNFTEQELDILRGAAERAIKKGRKGSEPGTIQMGYGDYAPGGEKASGTFSGTESAKYALTDLPSSLSFTLGMANVRREKDGSITITDKYDYNAKKKQVDDLKAKGIGAVLKMGVEGLARNGLLGPLNLLGNLMAPEGYGRDVKIRIPPKER